MKKENYNKVLISFLLRSGLAIVFIYAALSSILQPLNWTGYIPNFIELMWVSADNESKAFVKISKSSLPTDKTEIIQLKRGE